jgi:CubicO group peptidase (beta-lactamase class C family)
MLVIVSLFHLFMFAHSAYNQDSIIDLNQRDMYGRTQLHNAIYDGDKEKIELLLSNGADINAKTTDGLTPLHLAKIAGYKDIVALLISKGADQSIKLPDESTQIDALLISANDSPGASVIVIHNGKILHKKGYGLANLELDVPNIPQTKFRIASITKTFTSTAILQLHDKGLLNIDDTIEKYMADIQNGDKVTIRQLLNHTSGLLESGGLEFNPGDRINYSNYGYMLLGKIIEKITGMSYEKYLKENIFLPLNMINSGLDHSKDIIKNRASGYSVDQDGRFFNADYTDAANAYSAGGLHSTVEDMYLYDQALYSDVLVKSQTLQQAFSPTKLNDSRETGYGFGWMVSQYRGLREVGHGGDINGFNSYISRYPEQNFTVAVFSNISMSQKGNMPTAGDLAHRIAEIYLYERMLPRESQSMFKIDPKAYNDYIGQYKVNADEGIIKSRGAFIIITVENGHLFAIDNVAKEEILPESEDLFYIKSSPIKVKFVRNEKSEVVKLIAGMMGIREFHADKISGEIQTEQK